MRFPVNPKLSTDRSADDEDGQRFMDDPTLPQCLGGHQDDDHYGYEEAPEGSKTRFSVAKVERFIKMLEPIQDPIKALFGIGLLFHGRSFAHIILFTQVPTFRVADSSQPCLGGSRC